MDVQHTIQQQENAKDVMMDLDSTQQPTHADNASVGHGVMERNHVGPVQLGMNVFNAQTLLDVHNAKWGLE